MEQLQVVVINGVVSVLVVLIGVIFSGLKEFIIAKSNELRTKKSVQEFEMLQQIVAIGVNAVEQVAKATEVSSQEKLNQAVHIILTEGQRRGLRLDRTQVTPIVEAFVKEMNDVKKLVIAENK